MHAQWTDEGSQAIGEIARRYGFSEDAGRAMADALNQSAGSMAQFYHPDLGGMGQWSRGGMLMIGDMFNNGLKGRVAGLAEDLAAAMGRGEIVARRPAQGEASSGFGQWWPEELGSPSSTGAQNGRRYAVFPNARRLAIDADGRVRIYDTGDDRIGGASQQQGGGSSLSFSTDRGSVGVEQYREVGAAPAASEPAPYRAEPAPYAEATPPLRFERDAAPENVGGQPASPAPAAEPYSAADPAPATSSRADAADPIELIRKLASLRDAGVLTDEEFQSKKVELLARI